MKIVGFRPKLKKITVYDIETPCHNYILSNGVISHNTFDKFNPIAPGGGKGIYFASSCLVMATSKARDKEGDDISGAVITAKTLKGRFAIEHSKLKFTIKHDGGIHPVAGLEDELLDMGFIIKPNAGWYQRNFELLGLEGEDKKWRAKEMLDNWKEFYKPIINNKLVKEAFEKKFSFKHNTIENTDIFLDEENYND